MTYGFNSGFVTIAPQTRQASRAFGRGPGEAGRSYKAVVIDTDTSTMLGDAQPFEFGGDSKSGDTFDVAKTPNLGEPSTWYTNPGSGQMRLFGEDCMPVVDLDFDHVSARSQLEWQQQGWRR